LSSTTILPSFPLYNSFFPLRLYFPCTRFDFRFSILDGTTIRYDTIRLQHLSISYLGYDERSSFHTSYLPSSSNRCIGTRHAFPTTTTWSWLHGWLDTAYFSFLILLPHIHSMLRWINTCSRLPCLIFHLRGDEDTR
jgi:hypothetical protein